MDKALYTALSGVSRTMESQQVRANNLANISTTGFKADFNTVMADTIGGAMGGAMEGDSFDSRVHAENRSQWTDMTGGSLMFTGRKLDVAVQGEGWLAVIDETGNEAFTRAGNLHVDGEGILRTAKGMMVSGEGGPIQLPPFEQVVIGESGVISIQPDGADKDQIVETALLKLVNPDEANLRKDDQGLFRLPEGIPAEADPSVTVVSGYLENSNVNAVSEMVSFMTLSRTFETQLKMMQTTQKIAETGDVLLRD